MSTTCKTYAVPGAKGDPGVPGTNGTDGENAYTTVQTGFVMPAELGTVLVAVGNSDWISVGQLVYVSSCGTMQVTGKPSSTSVTLQNVEVNASGLYTGNVAPGTSVASGNTVSPSGLQGPSGAAAAGGLLAANNLSDVASVPTARSNLGIGTAGEQPIGYFLQQSLNLGDVASAATSRTNLGLDDMALQNSGNVNITGGQAVLTYAGIDALQSYLYASIEGVLLFTESGQTMNAVDAINATKSQWIIQGNGAPVTLVSTPSIVMTYSLGSLLYIRGGHATNTVTLSDESILAGSLLRLGATTRVISDKSTLVLLWTSSGSGYWQEVSFTNVI